MSNTAISKSPTIASPMLSVADACEYLKIRKSLLYELIARGDLPARKLAARTLILKCDADDFIERLPQAAIGEARNGAEGERKTPSSSQPT